MVYYYNCLYGGVLDRNYDQAQWVAGVAAMGFSLSGHGSVSRLRSIANHAIPLNVVIALNYLYIELMKGTD